MSPDGKPQPDAAIAQAKKLLPVEIRDRAIAAIEKCRSLEKGMKYCSLDYKQMLDF
jgi:hypothetical protein